MEKYINKIRLAFIGQQGIPAKFGGIEYYVESVVKMIIVSSDKCVGCEEANSFEVLCVLS